MEKSRKLFFVSMIVIALGVTFSTTLADTVGSLGIVLIAVGGLFFIMAMAERKKEQNGE